MAIARDLDERGLVLRIEDALRTEQMQMNLFQSDEVVGVVADRVVWELERQPTAEEVYGRLMSLCATTPKTGTHIGATAVDISVIDSATGLELDRGGPYLELSELTPMDSPFVSGEARRNREMITAVFAQHGFVAYPYEFWHYSKGDVFEALVTPHSESVPYGPVDVNLDDGTVSALANVLDPIGGLQAILDSIDKRLARTTD